MLSAARAKTHGETIGAPLAALGLLGVKMFAMSHETVVLPLFQAIAFLNHESIQASISKDGTVYASVFDYVFRGCDQEIAETNYWQFLSRQEVKKLHKANAVQRTE